MIGRYSDLSVYKDIFSSKDFIRACLGAALIPAAAAIQPGTGSNGLSAILLLASAAVNGLPIVLSALKGMVKRQMNVDELVSIAIVACLFSGNYFEAALVSAIMVIGALVEEAVSDSARNAIRELMAVTPDTAIIERGEKEVELPAAEIKQGDVLVVKQGQTIAVDGDVIEGPAAVDESAVTGEAIPVEKGEGDRGYAGSICVHGYLRILAKAVGRDSTMGRIVSLVQAAEQSQTSGARMVDRYAAWFTPVILTAAVLTLAVTRDVDRAITVLIVGCPCSFLLAGPVTTVAAVGRAAKSGILVKGGQYLEAIAKAGAFCFDKTGTITRGTPGVAGITARQGRTEAEVLTLAAAVEAKNLHPLARAIVGHAADQGLPSPLAREIRTMAGTGISGRVNGRLIAIETAICPDGGGFTCVRVLEDNNEIGLIRFEDRPRPEAAQTIERLRAIGIRESVMISGDQEGPVAKVAGQVGIRTFFSGQKPEDKLKRLTAFKDLGVVYVGDGINDAPALKLADTGIAMGLRGSDAALEAGDVVLMTDDLSLLPFLVMLSRKMTKRIRLNIWLSFALNAMAVAAGAGGLLTPVMGALFHNLGSILVVSLAAGLRYGRIGEAPIFSRSR